MSCSRAYSSIVALRQTLRAVSSHSSVVRATPSAYTTRNTVSLHTTAYRYNALEQQQPSLSPTPADTVGIASAIGAASSSSSSNLDGLHSQFEFDGETYEIPPIDEGNVVAVWNKAPIVHVKLSNLRKPPGASKRPVYVPLSAHVFDAPARRDLIHSAVVYYLDAQRSGTASTKSRSEVRGSKRKLRPQKGTGRARLGTMSSPSLRGGAVAHGPKPRDHSTKLPRRVRELALRSALSSKWRQGDLHVVSSLDWIPPPSSTAPMARLLGAKGWSNALFLTAPRNPQPSQRSLVKEARPSSEDPEYDTQQKLDHQQAIRNFVLATGNLPNIELIELDMLTDEYRKNIAKTNDDKKKPGELHAYEVLHRRKVICDLGAVEWLEEKLGGAIFHQNANLDTLTQSGQSQTDDSAPAPPVQTTPEAVPEQTSQSAVTAQ